MPIAVEAASRGDLDAVVALCAPVVAAHAALHPHLFPDGEDTAAMRAHFERRLAAPDGLLAVARLEGAVAGFAAGEVRTWRATAFTRYRPPYLHLEIIAVGPAFRRRGVGRALIDYVADFAAGRRIADIDAGQWASNSEAAAFYASVGFAPATQMWSRRRPGG